ncbi:hypothetical protein LF41_1162 [Lysobacter dokdonensis DS-58]|uniref:Uncharacterized protein n=1 Tax=Lysobacter dokdonensis DS-58 TaxID=1300345 RepID=A0A0A2X5X6_9GAMM|nr:hypothetical protein [Lysobacter dokdonensis]KGQ20624.1 hypothetical protein LF41_1162 [Lysobacter dokdonensis DS-58]
MALNPMKPDESTMAQRLGATTRRITEAVGQVRDTALMRPLQALDQAHASAQQAAGNFVRDFGASYTAGKPVTAPPSFGSSRRAASALNAGASTPTGAGSTPSGGAPTPPRPNFAGAQGNFRLLPLPALRPGDANTFTGANGVTQVVQSSVAAPVSRPAFTAPSIAPVDVPGVTGQSESTAQRAGREASISEIGSQLFQLRGKNTRSARDVSSDLIRTQADLTNTAGNQAVALKAANSEAQTRASLAALDRQGVNDLGVTAVRADNERASLLDAGDTERERIKHERPSLLRDRDGGYLLVNPAQGVARPVLSNGQQVRGLVEGAITPVDRLASLQEELAASQQSLAPDAVRIEALQRQVDQVRAGTSGNATPNPIRPGSYEEFLAKARAVNPRASDADIRAYYDKTYGGGRKEGAP